MEEKRFLKAFSLFYSPLQTFGGSPIRLVETQTGYHFRKSYFGIFCIVILIILIITSTSFVFGFIDDGSIVFDNNKRTILLKWHNYLRLFLGPNLAVFLLFFTICTASKACETLYSISESASTLITSPSKLLSLRPVALLVALVIKLIASVYFECEAISHITNDQLDPGKYAVFLISWIAFDFASFVTLIQLFGVSVSFLWQLQRLEMEVSGVKDYNWFTVGKVSSIFEKNVKGSAESRMPRDIRRHSKTYLKLTCIADDINDLFGTRILIMVAFTLILLYFTCYMSLFNMEDTSFALPLDVVCYWLFIRIYTIAVIFLPFCLIQEKAADISRCVHLWITKVEKHIIIEELMSFSQHLVNRKIEFTAHNFFCLKASTLSSILGSSITYMVVLVQFHLVFKDSNGGDIMSAMPWNYGATIPNATYY